MSVSEITDLLAPPSNEVINCKIQREEDPRLKFLFLGNWPKNTENPDLHFLVTPASYEPGITPGTHEILYASVCPDYVTTFFTNDGKIKPVKIKKGTYLVLVDEEQRKRERVLPFMLGDERVYKLMKRGFADKILEIQADIVRHKFGIPYDDTAKDEDDAPWQASRDAKDDIVKATSDIYVVLKDYFEHAFNKTQPVRRTSLHPNDWLKKIMPVSAEGRILDYVKDVIYWMVHGE